MSRSRQVVALFGEAEKGQFQKPYVVQELPQLMEVLGHPPQMSCGIFFAIQALLYHRELIYFRVPEEGFSRAEYFFGFNYLKEKVKQLDALCLPGVGEPLLLEASEPICAQHKSILISTEKDLFDYLTN